MDLTKTSTDLGPSGAAAPSLRSPASLSTFTTPATPTTSSSGSSSPTSGSLALEQLVSLADRVEIRPLDLAGSLRILIAEVQADLGFPGDMPDTEDPARVPQAVVQMFLRAVPETLLEPAAWMAAVMRVESTLQSALDKAIETVSTWQGVTQGTVDAALVTRAVVNAALTDEPPNPVWLRPEWLGLATQFRRYRLRRIAARRFSDPDLYAREMARMSDENDPEYLAAQ